MLTNDIVSFEQLGPDQSEQPQSDQHFCWSLCGQSRSQGFYPCPVEQINLATPISDYQLIQLLDIMYSSNSQTT